MNKVIEGERVPIKLWLDDIEDSAMVQVENLARLPFVFKHVAVMPDAHCGYGMPIGGVMATKGVVVPNAVGVDIGCGMCAVKTSLTEVDHGTIKKIFGGSKENHGGIRSCVPVGFSHQSRKQDEELMPQRTDDTMESMFVVSQQYQSALKQLGTLGGGNHFIEIQKGSDGFVWLMLHSGSRNLGLKVAKYYNEVAYDLNVKWHSQTHLPRNKEDSLAFLPTDSDEGMAYLREMEYCVDFALHSRQLMMDRIKACVYAVEPSVSFDEEINIAHNYATMENHFGQNVMVHRKGATMAREGQLGIVPGSQGTASYIVKGKGNPESFQSCSHGAGRKMSRKQAKRELSLVGETNAMAGIIHTLRTENDLDEAPGAYKDISVVMANQEDLVDIVVELKPLAVIKG